VEVRFHTNPDGEPHIHDHGVAEAEVREALGQPIIQTAGRNASHVLLVRTSAGRILKIVFADCPGRAMESLSLRHMSCPPSNSERCVG
jgi:hypothetical protein